MTRRFKVEWMEVARRDVERVADHLWVEAPLRAEQALDRLIDRAEALHSVPHRGRRVPELAELAESTWREVHHPPWRIVYRVQARVVEIHGVFDSRRDLVEVLRDRMLWWR